jgi:hypothetical protein
VSEDINIDDLAGTYEQLRNVKEQIAKLKELQTVLEEQLKAAIGEGNIGLIDGKPVASYRVYSKRQFQLAHFKEVMPSFYDNYCTTVTSTTFRLIDPDKNTD